jgi:hypothetical protein
VQEIPSKLSEPGVVADFNAQNKPSQSGTGSFISPNGAVVMSAFVVVTITWFCLQSPLSNPHLRGPIFGYWSVHAVIFDCEFQCQGFSAVVTSCACVHRLDSFNFSKFM